MAVDHADPTLTRRSAGADDLLRFATAGSVDDGKSTLIGRLLHDSKSLFDDVLESLAVTTARRGGEGLDLALVTDGLRAEREQGITIDVAYRYFSTPHRSFIIADTPGHVQYTRNMVTGASTSDVAVILVDARHGLREQSHRHTALSALLGIRHLVLAVNKMDLVGWSQDRYEEIRLAFADLATGLGVASVQAIPLCALDGSNVVDRSPLTPWYSGPSLLEHLETVPIPTMSTTDDALRLPIQWVVRPDARSVNGKRWYAGQLAAGSLHVGQQVIAVPVGGSSHIVAVEGEAPAVRVQLADELDIGRGTVLSSPTSPPLTTTQVTATVAWLGDQPLVAGTRYAVKHLSTVAKAMVTDIHDRLDVRSLAHGPADSLGSNEIGTVSFTLSAPLAVDTYAANRRTGSFIVIDERSNATVGAAMIVNR
jgi:bifunctional enzyme CysN/CysC